jgi:hypothetical protein
MLFRANGNAPMLSKIGDFMASPLFLRFLGILLVGTGLLGILKGLFGDLSEDELWWGYVGMGIVSIGFSVGLFICASAEAEMRAGSDGANKEEHRPSTSNANTSEHTLH